MSIISKINTILKIIRNDDKFMPQLIHLSKTYFEKRKRTINSYKRIRNLTSFIGVKDGSFSYIVSTSDYHGGYKLFSEKNNLTNELTILYDWCKSNLNILQDSNKILINVGANIGAVAIPSVFEGYFSSAIAFEPEPLNFKLLKVNISLNNIEQRIKACKIALSNSNKTNSMYLSEHNLGAHAVFEKEVNKEDLVSKDKDNNLKFDVINVECQTMDYFIKNNNIDISDIGLVFMDIEGHEGHFLEGAQDLLKKKIPIITEFYPPFLFRSNGADKFLNNTFKYFSKVIIDPFHNYKQKNEMKIQDIKVLKNLINSDGFYNLLLIP